MNDWATLLKNMQAGDRRSLARGITLIENEVPGYDRLMEALPYTGDVKIIGITGAPGAGKSTLVDALIGAIVKHGKKTGVLCVDPSSPFNFGALLGDRIRMSEWYTHPSVFIRSLATRGSLGGLNPKILEITEWMKAAGFDYIIVETVGVGQSEVEIAGLADVTAVVVVPEAGDEVQTMKAGLMEIADIFVLNKADRPDADRFVKNLRLMLAPAFASHHQDVPIVKTVASQNKGVEELFEKLVYLLEQSHSPSQQAWLFAERAYYLVQQYRMKDLSKETMKHLIEKALQQDGFNLYRFVQQFISTQAS